MFAFLASMDNDPKSIVSTGLILLAIVTLIIGNRPVGLRRLADF
jgi:hypothetical protein